MQVNKKNVGGLSVSGKGLYIDDQNCPHLVNLNEDPLMTECLVYFLAPGQTVVGSDVGDEDGKAENKHTISLVGQTIAPHHCAFDNSDGHVYIEPIMGAVTFVNGRRIAEKTLLRQGNRIMVGSSHIFRFNDPVEATRIRKEREVSVGAWKRRGGGNPGMVDGWRGAEAGACACEFFRSFENSSCSHAQGAQAHLFRVMSLPFLPL